MKNGVRELFAAFMVIIEMAIKNSIKGWYPKPTSRRHFRNDLVDLLFTPLERLTSTSSDNFSVIGVYRSFHLVSIYHSMTNDRLEGKEGGVPVVLATRRRSWSRSKCNFKSIVSLSVIPLPHFRLSLRESGLSSINRFFIQFFVASCENSQSLSLLN